MTYFVWTKIGPDGGQSLDAVLARREFEREIGSGSFWWAIGTSLGAAVHAKARNAGGTLPVRFSCMRSKPRSVDTNPGQIFIWREWSDTTGATHPIPPHLRLWSNGSEIKKQHYALICQSDRTLAVQDHGAFDERVCFTHLGNRPGGSQVTALLTDECQGVHELGRYQFGFYATLVEPWCVRLVNPRPMTTAERQEFADWPRKPSDWTMFRESYSWYG